MSQIPSHDDLAEKESRLRDIIAEAVQDNGRVLVAFSGGVDSSLLLWESVQALGKAAVTAVTATSPTSFPEEEQSARAFAAHLGVEHRIVSAGECSDESFTRNPEDRCYVCKRIRYSYLKTEAESEGAVVFDGTQADDDPADRPGMKALNELAIRAPLAEARLSKNEVRSLLRSAGFTELAEKEAQPCLATRFPPGTRITLNGLEMVGNAERILLDHGLKKVRVRHHFPLARIVTDGSGISKVLSGPELRESIVLQLKEIGYLHVTLDLEPYGKRES
jgi:pyridinium-3,5-biscarboxylic acid mononucleotide sulfurtransferase